VDNREVATEECLDADLIEIMLQMCKGFLVEHDNLRAVYHPSRVDDHVESINP